MTTNYRRLFLAIAALNIMLVLAVFAFWWKGYRPQRVGDQGSQSQKREAAPGGAAEGAAEGTAVQQSSAETASDDPRLAAVELSPQRMQSIGVQIGVAAYKNLESGVRSTGTVVVDEQRIAYVQTRFSGYLHEVYANETYKFVRKGQPLFTIYSPELVASEREYLLARRSAAALTGSSIEEVASGARSLEEAARGRLAQWNISAGDLRKMEASGSPITNLAFPSPVSGYITERQALPNVYVQPEMRLYTVADLSTVWVNAQVFQDDLSKMRPGGSAVVTVDAYPTLRLSARILQILPQVDLTTRTASVRLQLLNSGLRLLPGMFVNVQFETTSSRQLTVPSSAVLQTGMRQVVFLSKGNGSFLPTEVQTGTSNGVDTVITRGLQAGNAVATSASFLLDSESQFQAAAGAYAPPAPSTGPAGADATARAESPANIELTTSPSPAHKGSNVLRVRLTQEDGRPVAGADVTVVFSMAAMPAMGMAAMNTAAHLTEKAGGFYEGSGVLGSGGTWQVTISATKGGKTIASRHLSVNAEGGM